MGFVTAKEVARVMNLDKMGFLGTTAGWVILRTTKLSRLNKEYQKRKNLKGVEFIDSILEGFEIQKLLLEQRQDYKIIANFLLHRLDPLRPFIMPVNPFETRKDAKSSVGGIKEAIAHLREGHGLGMFPAGEVSTYKDEKLIVDKPWEPVAMRLIQKAKVPVVPIYFHAKNSTFFYRLASMSDVLRTAKLPSEMLSQKRRKIKVRP